MGFLDEQDKIKRDLEQQFPGWHIWFVPGMNKKVTWCAQPWPLINSGSPEHLAADITSAHTEAAAEWPALAGLDDYADTAPGIIRPEAI